MKKFKRTVAVMTAGLLCMAGTPTLPAELQRTISLIANAVDDVELDENAWYIYQGSWDESPIVLAPGNDGFLTVRCCKLNASGSRRLDYSEVRDYIKINSTYDESLIQVDEETGNVAAIEGTDGGTTQVILEDMQGNTQEITVKVLGKEPELVGLQVESTKYSHYQPIGGSIEIWDFGNIDITFDYYTGYPDYELVKGVYTPDLFEIDYDSKYLTFYKSEGRFYASFIPGGTSTDTTITVSDGLGFEEKINVRLCGSTTTTATTTTTTTTTTAFTTTTGMQTTSTTPQTTTVTQTTTPATTTITETTSQPITTETTMTTTATTSQPVATTTTEFTTTVTQATTTAMQTTTQPKTETTMTTTATTSQPVATTTTEFTTTATQTTSTAMQTTTQPKTETTMTTTATTSQPVATTTTEFTTTATQETTTATQAITTAMQTTETTTLATTTATETTTLATTEEPVETTVTETTEEPIAETTTQATTEEPVETTVTETTEEPIATTETTPEATEEPATDDPNNGEDLPETGTTGMPPARIAEYFALMLTIAGAGMITKFRKKED